MSNVLGSVYTGMSGMMTYSKGLDVISNNVANLNTAGFKGSDLVYRDLFYKYQLLATQGEHFNNDVDGSGVGNAGTLTRFEQGDTQETSNDTDAAVQGNGFFVVQGKEGTYYTRAGQFQFDDEGTLVTADTAERVAGLDDGGGLVDISLTGLRTSAARPTGQVSFAGNLSIGSSSHEVSDVKVIDRVGGEQTLKLTFTNTDSTTPRSWSIDVQDADGNSVAAGLQIGFQVNGSPEDGANQVTFSYAPDGGESFDITLFFGAPGSFTGATSFSGGSTSTLAVQTQDGVGAGSLLGTTFLSNGTLELSYSNGEIQSGPRLAMAWFEDLQNLQQIGGGRFVPRLDQRLNLGHAGEGVFGAIKGGAIEISNIDLSQEFTDLIIVQRGFQASSQVVTVANEMMQHLLDMGRGR